jgi:hypothetical protein
MEQSTSWEDNSCLANPLIPLILGNPKVYYHEHNSPTMGLIMAHMNPTYMLISVTLHINLNICSCSDLQWWQVIKRKMTWRFSASQMKKELYSRHNTSVIEIRIDRIWQINNYNVAVLRNSICSVWVDFSY